MALPNVGIIRKVTAQFNGQTSVTVPLVQALTQGSSVVTIECVLDSVNGQDFALSNNGSGMPWQRFSSGSIGSPNPYPLVSVAYALNHNTSNNTQITFTKANSCTGTVAVIELSGGVWSAALKCAYNASSSTSTPPGAMFAGVSNGSSAAPGGNAVFSIVGIVLASGVNNTGLDGPPTYLNTGTPWISLFHSDDGVGFAAVDMAYRFDINNANQGNIQARWHYKQPGTAISFVSEFAAFTCATGPTSFFHEMLEM
jgi:hypothetical protein